MDLFSHMYLLCLDFVLGCQNSGGNYIPESFPQTILRHQESSSLRRSLERAPQSHVTKLFNLGHDSKPNHGQTC